MIPFDDTLISWADGIADGVHAKVPPSFDRDDLRQVARIATWQASLEFDPAIAAGRYPFAAFAWHRVRGAVLMSIRRRNWTEATQHVEFQPDYDSPVAPESLPDAEILAHDESERIRRMMVKALRFVTQPERSVVVATYLLGTPMAVVAMRLPCSLSGAYAYRARGLKQIAEHIDRAKDKRPNLATPPDGDGVLTLAEAARFAGLSKDAMYWRVLAGHLPAEQGVRGGAIKIPRGPFREWYLVYKSELREESNGGS